LLSRREFAECRALLIPTKAGATRSSVSTRLSFQTTPLAEQVNAQLNAGASGFAVGISDNRSRPLYRGAGIILARMYMNDAEQG